ncbi:MAG: DUF4843 domain-containing protein [Bacteroidaceae bacterium]|nr:DUF4843 domain-containing protein [Bacteroidaceae bacterium]
MKKSILYIVWLFGLMPVFTACEDRVPDLFDEDSNGAYFDYEYAEEFNHTLNFSEYIVGDPDTVTTILKVKLLGYLMDEARTLSIKTKPVEGYELPDITIGEVVFANKEYEKQIEVKVKRPELEDSTYAVCIYLDGSGDIGAAVEGMNEINLYVKESYEKPKVWYSHMDTYLGAWNKEKHKFLARHTGDNFFYSKLYDNDLDQHLFDSIVALNVSAVNALLANKPTEDIVVDLPIIKESDHPAYSKPYFWSDYEELLGMFRVNKFCRFTTMLGGATTKDIAALYATESAMLKMEEAANDFHKDDVLYMLDEYYNYAKQGLPISEYRNLCWVKIKNGPNYKVRIPFWWEDPDSLGTAAIVKEYFGEYSDNKYQFILKQVMKKDGGDNFVAASILPFVYDKENGTYAWDDSPFGVEKLSGKERLKECYSIVKAANEKRQPEERFDIPDVDLSDD